MVAPPAGARRRAALRPCACYMTTLCCAAAGETMRAEREDVSRKGQAGRKFCTWLACLSLLFQLVVTAGHFHREDFALIAAGKATPVAASSASGALAQPIGQPTLPTHDDCALCFSLQLASSSALPMPVLLPLP